MTLSTSIWEVMAYARECKARKFGVDEKDISFMKQTGMDAFDIATLKRFTDENNLLMIARCPGEKARAWHGIFPAKSAATSEKTGDSGLVVREKNGLIMVSDYDLMSIWQFEGSQYKKVFTAAQGGAKRGKYTEKARSLLSRLNGGLVTKIQHGCQDDWMNQDNRGVKNTDMYAAFERGKAIYLRNNTECQRFYINNGLHWPYDLNGKLIGF